MASSKDKMKAGLGNFFQQAREQHAASEQTGVREVPTMTPVELPISPASGGAVEPSLPSVEESTSSAPGISSEESSQSTMVRPSTAVDVEGDNVYRLRGEDAPRVSTEEANSSAEPRVEKKSSAEPRTEKKKPAAPPRAPAVPAQTVEAFENDDSNGEATPKRWYGTIDETYVRDRDGIETRKRSFTLSVDLITEIERICLSPKRSVNVWLEEHLRRAVGLPPIPQAEDK